VPGGVSPRRFAGSIRFEVFTGSRFGHGIEFSDSLEYAISDATLALLAFSNGRRVAAVDNPASMGLAFTEFKLKLEFLLHQLPMAYRC
jgi:hypothetical protein